MRCCCCCRPCWRYTRSCTQTVKSCELGLLLYRLCEVAPERSRGWWPQPLLTMRVVHGTRRRQREKELSKSMMPPDVLDGPYDMKVVWWTAAEATAALAAAEKQSPTVLLQRQPPQQRPDRWQCAMRSSLWVTCTSASHAVNVSGQSSSSRRRDWHDCACSREHRVAAYVVVIMCLPSLSYMPKGVA